MKIRLSVSFLRLSCRRVRVVIKCCGPWIWTEQPHVSRAARLLFGEINIYFHQEGLAPSDVPRTRFLSPRPISPWNWVYAASFSRISRCGIGFWRLAGSSSWCLNGSPFSRCYLFLRGRRPSEAFLQGGPGAFWVECSVWRDSQDKWGLDCLGEKSWITRMRI